jgi:hypothetical protein
MVNELFASPIRGKLLVQIRSSRRCGASRAPQRLPDD